MKEFTLHSTCVFYGRLVNFNDFIQAIIYCIKGRKIISQHLHTLMTSFTTK